MNSPPNYVGFRVNRANTRSRTKVLNRALTAASKPFFDVVEGFIDRINQDRAVTNNRLYWL